MIFIGFNTWKKLSNRPLERPEVMLLQHKQEAQLMLTNPRDAFTAGMVSYQCSIET